MLRILAVFWIFMGTSGTIHLLPNFTSISRRARLREHSHRWSALARFAAETAWHQLLWPTDVGCDFLGSGRGWAERFCTSNISPCRARSRTPRADAAA